MSPISNAHFVAPSVPQVLREISVVGVWCNLYIFTAAVKVRFIAIDNTPGYSVAGSAEIYYVLACLLHPICASLPTYLPRAVLLQFCRMLFGFEGD